MELALHHPAGGYYATRPDRIGKSGDFFTASDAGHGFGECLARQALEIDRTIGPFDPFHVVEIGAGRGLLARDFLDAMRVAHPDLASRLDYTMVDRSPAMRAESSRMTPEARSVTDAQMMPDLDGLVLAVELFDALPVHRVRRSGDALTEVHVDIDEGARLVECERPTSPSIAGLAARYGAAIPDGSEAELCPAAGEMMACIARTLRRGVAIIVDYGDPAPELFARTRGTLLAYHAHGTNEQFLERVGEQDLTAHVNFTLLQDLAREHGMQVLGLTTQDRFLIANGLLEIFEDQQPGRLQDPLRAKRRLQAMQLIHPSSMGRRFKVLVLSKGCDPPPTLAGLRDPFSREGPL